MCIKLQWPFLEIDVVDESQRHLLFRQVALDHESFVTIGDIFNLELSPKLKKVNKCLEVFGSSDGFTTKVELNLSDYLEYIEANKLFFLVFSVKEP